MTLQSKKAYDTDEVTASPPPWCNVSTVLIGLELYVLSYDLFGYGL